MGIDSKDNPAYNNFINSILNTKKPSKREVLAERKRQEAAKEVTDNQIASGQTTVETVKRPALESDKPFGYIPGGRPGRDRKSILNNPKWENQNKDK